jgi:hypothetical protein
MARSLVDVHLNNSVSRLSDNDLTYCNAKRGAALLPHVQRALVERENIVFCRAIATQKTRDGRDHVL